MNPYNIIAPHFYDLLDDVLDNKHTHYWLKVEEEVQSQVL